MWGEAEGSILKNYTEESVSVSERDLGVQYLKKWLQTPQKKK